MFGSVGENGYLCGNGNNLYLMGQSIRVGITHGDINGISYEVIMKGLGDDRITELCTPVVFGSVRLFSFFRKQYGLEDFSYHVAPDAGSAREGRVNIVNITDEELIVEPGKGTPAAGVAALLSLEAGVEALREGTIDVLVTAPINKDTIQSDDFRFPGHTEYLESELGGEDDKALMILFNDLMRVALVTTHLPLKDVAGEVTKERVAEKIRVFARSLRLDFGIDGPRIAVLALNPHAGDGGLLGSEEETAIKPAIEETFAEGILVFGPYAADGFFGRSREIEFDGVLAMYHDQGLIPLKASSDEKGVNFTAGLPFVRTSPDHGTGYDIAGKGQASASSFREAIYRAIDIYRTRKRMERSLANPLRKQYVERGADKTVDLSKEE